MSFQNPYPCSTCNAQEYCEGVGCYSREAYYEEKKKQESKKKGGK